MSYKEKRVYVEVYGTLPADSPLLVDVPTALGHEQQKLHKLAGKSFMSLSAAAENDLGFPLLVASGLRPKRWPTFSDYEVALVAKYQARLNTMLKRLATREEVIKYGRKYLAYLSPHQTGLVADLGCGGLTPDSTTITAQMKTPLFKWLVQHMWEYGWTPYLHEPWHIEYNVTLTAYRDKGPQRECPPHIVQRIGEQLVNDVCEDNLCLDVPLVLSDKT